MNRTNTGPREIAAWLRRFVFSKEWTFEKAEGEATHEERMEILNRIGDAADALDRLQGQLDEIRTVLGRE